jgi:DNA-binding beta-propeller fold protein YncE
MHISIPPDGTYALIADKNNHRIRKMTMGAGAVTTLSGSGTAGYANGVSSVAKFHYPWGISISPDGTAARHRIRKVMISTGATTLLAIGMLRTVLHEWFRTSSHMPRL